MCCQVLCVQSVNRVTVFKMLEINVKSAAAGRCIVLELRSANGAGLDKG